LTAEEDWLSFALPYGWWPIIPTIAMMMRRRLHEFGGSLEEYGYIAINARRWARFNPFAVLRQPLTMDEYLSSRVLAEPLKLLDCDLPVTAVGAICIVSESVAHDLKHRPVWVDAVAFGTGSNPDWIFLDDYIYGASRLCSERLWKKSQFTIRDVDVALLYDGFTHITLSWLEALGFCGLGEAGAFIENGKAIGPGGRLPLNTNGGQLAEGRLHGIGLIIEAVLQLQGRCGLRQIKDAKVAVVTNGFGPQCGAMLLYTDD
jgi:acetyl-CoA acetyltransferase